MIIILLALFFTTGTSRLFSAGTPNINEKDKKGMTRLHRACYEKKSLKCSQELKACFEDKTIDINLQDNDGNTPLHYAAKHNNIEALKYLEKANANVTLKNKNNETALHEAAGNSDPQSTIIITTLLKMSVTQNANLREVTGSSDELPLHKAAASGNIENIMMLSNAPENSAKAKDLNNRKNSLGRIALHLAAAKNRLEAIKTLITLGADINAQDNFGNTPLFL